MDAQPQPASPDPTTVLARDAYYYLVYTLQSALPPPQTDTPDERLRRDHAAIAQVAGLCPANQAEALLAATFVAATAHAMDSLRSSSTAGIDLDLALKCRAQATSMMRQAQGAMRLLQNAQAARHKIESNTVTADRAAWSEHCTAGLMLQSMPGAAPQQYPQPAPPRPPAPEPAPVIEPKPDPEAELLAEAETYAKIYPQRAALIRRLGRVPDDVSFGPPEPELVRLLITGRTPTLQALDQQAEPVSPGLPRADRRAAAWASRSTRDTKAGSPARPG